VYLRAEPITLRQDCELPALSAWSSSVLVKEQSARVPTEWLLQLGGLLRGPAGPSGDLDIARGVLHV